MKKLSSVLMGLAFCASVSPAARASDASYSIKLMTPETALKAAVAGLKACRDAGFQVAIAIVDRTGQTQVVLRDRFAGMHTPNAAVDKAWTAASFKSSTTQFAEATQAGKPSSGIRAMPRVLAIGGGLMIEAGGSLMGAIGVSGAPDGEKDDACAKAGVEAIRDDIEL